jgi:hypothetical protein
MTDSAAQADTKIAVAGIIKSLAENSPTREPIALVGAGLVAGVILMETDPRVTLAAINASFDKTALDGVRVNCRSIVEMWAALRAVHEALALTKAQGAASAGGN